MQGQTINAELQKYNQVFDNELFKIADMKTFYIEDWKRDISFLEKTNPQKVYTRRPQKERNKGFIKSLHLKQKSNSLPTISNIAMPIIDMDTNKKMSKRKQLYQSEYSINERLHIIENAHKQESNMSYLKKNIESQKKIIRQINQEIKNEKQVKGRRIIFESQKKLNSYQIKNRLQSHIKATNNSETYVSNFSRDKNQFNYDRISRLIEYKDSNFAADNNHKKLVQNLRNLSKSSPVDQQQIQQIMKQYKNKSLINQQYSILGERQKDQMDKNKKQKNSKTFKIIMRRDAINKILRKYEPYHGLESERIFNLKQIQKRRRNSLIKQMIEQKRKETLHASSLKKFIQYRSKNISDIKTIIDKSSQINNLINKKTQLNINANLQSPLQYHPQLRYQLKTNKTVDKT